MRSGVPAQQVEQRPGRVFRKWSLELEQEAEWNHGRDFLGGSLSLAAEAELLSYWSGDRQNCALLGLAVTANS